MHKTITGWFKIDETWSIWIDGELTDVYVDHVKVRKAHGNDYKIEMYSPLGEKIKSELLTHDDLTADIAIAEPVENNPYV